MRTVRTMQKLCSGRLLVGAGFLSARHSARQVVSDSVWRGSVRESEMSACVGGRERRPVSTYRPPFEMVTLS